MPPSRFGHLRDEKNPILLAGTEPTDRPASTALPQLRTAGKLKSCSIYILICTRALTACDKLFSNCNVKVPLVGRLQRRLYGRL